MQIQSLDFGNRRKPEGELRVNYWAEMANGRRHIRYPLKASIRYHWRDAQGQLRSGRGWTRDVSEAGVLVVTANCPTKGDLVDLTLRMPKQKKTVASPPVLVVMSGEVVRVLINASGKAVCGFAMERRDKGPRKTRKTTNLALQSGDSERRRWN